MIGAVSAMARNSASFWHFIVGTVEYRSPAEIIPVGERHQSAATDCHHRHPAFFAVFAAAQQRRRAFAQRHAVQGLKPIEPVKQARLRLAVKRTGCGGLRSQEIIVIFTLNRQKVPNINPTVQANGPMTDDLPAFPLDHLPLRGAPDLPALRFKDRVYSYQLLNHRIGRLAAILAAHDFTKCDRVATWLPKTELACLMPLAAVRAGLVHVPVNPLLKPAQVRHIMADSGAKVLITAKGRAEQYLSHYPFGSSESRCQRSRIAAGCLDCARHERKCLLCLL